MVDPPIRNAVPCRSSVGGAWRKIILAMVLVAPAASSRDAAAAEQWVSDPITGCEIWAADTEPAENIAIWTGSCVDGKADGVGNLVWFKNGSLLGRYHGAMRDGKIQGHGEIYHFSRQGVYDRYEGDFVDGDIEGYLVHEGANGDRLEGQF